METKTPEDLQETEKAIVNQGRRLNRERKAEQEAKKAEQRFKRSVKNYGRSYRTQDNRQYVYMPDGSVRRTDKIRTPRPVTPVNRLKHCKTNRERKRLRLKLKKAQA